MKGVGLLVITAICLFLYVNGEQDSKKNIIKEVVRSAQPNNCGAAAQLLLTHLKVMNKKLDLCVKNVEKCTNGHTFSCTYVPKNCAEVLKCGGKNNGIYSIDPDGKGAFKVFCDQKTTGGGWTVFQKREDGSVDFFRGWHDYKNGFGNLNGEVWLGLDKIYRLTHQTRNRLRVELEDTMGKSEYAEYDYFAVSSERSKYQLSIGAYSGTAGNSMTFHRGNSFSTKDHDNDKASGNCAVLYKGGWWYNACHSANLNGLYHLGKHKSYADGINWYTWKGHHYSAKRSEMKIRPL